MFYRKWKIKNVIVLDVQSAAYLEAFLIKQGMLFSARLQCIRHSQRHVRAIAHLICQSLLWCGGGDPSVFEICFSTRQLPRLLLREFCMCVGKLLPRQNCLNNIYVNYWIIYCKKNRYANFYTHIHCIVRTNSHNCSYL